jgi:hypothetical protein
MNEINGGGQAQRKRIRALVVGTHSPVVPPLQDFIGTPRVTFREVVDPLKIYLGIGFTYNFPRESGAAPYARIAGARGRGLRYRIRYRNTVTGPGAEARGHAPLAPARQRLLCATARPGEPVFAKR